MEARSVHLFADDVNEMPVANHEESARLLEKLQHIEERVALADLLEVRRTTSRDTHALYVKHMTSIGCPSWTASDGRFGPFITPVTYALCTESGTDEVGFKSMAVEESTFNNTSYDPTAAHPVEDCDEDNTSAVFSLDTMCWMHVYHLMAKKSYKSTDLMCKALEKWSNAKRNYFSTIAKIMHTWRDCSKSIKTAWLAFGNKAAQEFAGKRPPLAMSGRWGQTEKSEEAYGSAPYTSCAHLSR